MIEPSFDELIDNIAKQSKEIISAMTANQPDSPMHGFRFVFELGMSYHRLLKDYCRLCLKQAPSRMILKSLKDQLKTLARSFVQSLLNDKQPPSMIKPEAHDRQFRHPDWHQKKGFNFIMQAYLLIARELRHLAQTSTMTGKDKKQIIFCTELLIETLHPKNILLTNPEALHYTRQHRGKNILKGLGFFLEDLQRWQGHINLTKTNLSAFQVGKNLATSPGKVVFRNHLMELIYYEPKTAQLYAEPILMVTSWINKFYILDLSPKNSLVQWTLDQGFSVFAISWINPSDNEQELGVEQYLQDGITQAINTIQGLTQAKPIHAMGYCLGGTLLAIAAAHLQHHQIKALASLTLVATLTDFSDGGGIGNLMGPEQLKVYEKTLERYHVWDGHKMQIGFNLTNSNHFIWPFVQRRYQQGKSSVAIDSIYWGLDLANTTEALYRFYTEDLHHHNRLASNNPLVIQGAPIHLNAIKLPTCCVAFEQDTISPWRDCYTTTKLIQHECHFILAQGTHITGLIAHPGQKKNHFQSDIAQQNSPDQWHKTATNQNDSWWLGWTQWLAKESQQQTKPHQYAEVTCLAPAPGSYVLNTPNDSPD